MRINETVDVNKTKNFTTTKKKRNNYEAVPFDLFIRYQVFFFIHFACALCGFLLFKLIRVVRDKKKDIFPYEIFFLLLEFLSFFFLYFRFFFR